MDTKNAAALVPAGMKKFSNAQWDLVKGNLSAEQIDAFTKAGLVPTRDAFGGGGERSTERERQEIFKGLTGSPEEDKQTLSMNICKVLDAGFPTSATLAPYWAGVAGGSMVAWSQGWVSSLKLHRTVKNGRLGESFRIDLELRAITAEDIEPRKKAWTKAYPKKTFPMPPGFEPPVNGVSEDASLTNEDSEDLPEEAGSTGEAVEE